MNFEFYEIIPYIIPGILWILTAAITIRLIVKKQEVSVTISWLMAIYLIPIFGVIFYLLFGEIQLGRKYASKSTKYFHYFTEWLTIFNQRFKFELIDSSSVAKPLHDLCYKRLHIPPVSGNQLQLFSTPEQILDAVINDIKNAKFTIHMVFYIFQAGGLVDSVIQELLNAKKRGVEIKILLDSVGSAKFFRHPAYKLLLANGIDVKEALHVNIFRMLLQRLDLRLHRKIISIDQKIAYTGSMNMVDPQLFKQNENLGQWVDVMVRINGPVSSILDGVYGYDWITNTDEECMPDIPEYSNPINKNSVQILPTGPSYTSDIMSQALISALFAAQESIIITSPYFVPSHNIVEALRIAALRGVKIKIILPQVNDSMMVKWASRTFFETLLAEGVEIYWFQKGLLHTKSISIDNQLSLVGTVNMDIRSFRLNFEVTLVIDNPDFAKQMILLQNNYIADSIRLDKNEWNKRPLYHRVIEKLFFLFSPLL